MTIGAISIRLARVEEQAELEALQLRASLANESDREALLAHPDAVALPMEQIEAGEVVIAELDGRIAGFAAILARQDGDLELDGLFVEPALWREGIGRGLVECAAARARVGGAAFLHVIGHPEAEGFYRACGFERVGSCATRFGPAPLMRKAV